MNNRFDELTKTMAQSVTRRGALKRFGVGLAGMALAASDWRRGRMRPAAMDLAPVSTAVSGALLMRNAAAAIAGIPIGLIDAPRRTGRQRDARLLRI